MRVTLFDLPRMMRDTREPHTPWYRRLWRYLRADSLDREQMQQERR